MLIPVSLMNGNSNRSCFLYCLGVQSEALFEDLQTIGYLNKGPPIHFKWKFMGGSLHILTYNSLDTIWYKFSVEVSHKAKGHQMMKIQQWSKAKSILFSLTASA
jgi:hypothetical protein